MNNRLTFDYQKYGSFDVIISNGFEDLKSFKDMVGRYGRIFAAADPDSGFDVSDLNPIPGLSDNSITAIDFEHLYTLSLSSDDLLIAYGNKTVIDTVKSSGCDYIIIPTDHMSALFGGVYGFEVTGDKKSLHIPLAVYVNTDIVTKLAKNDYIDFMSEVLRLALIRDASFYEWMILNFTDIMERDPEYVNELLFKALSVMQFFAAKDPFGKKEAELLTFGSDIAEALKINDFEFCSGEYLGLGMIAASYISYKKQLLSKEEFYEIRDMFVPFGLTISLDPFDTDKTVGNLFPAEESDNKYKMILLKKTGRAFICSEVSEDEIIEAVKQLIVEWD